MPVPFKVLADGHSKVFAGLNGFKLVVVEDVFGVDGVTLPGDLDDNALFWVERHLPLLLPMFQ